MDLIEFNMDLKERIIKCRRCKNKKFDVALGIICSLTNKPPAFNGKCSNYIEDSLEVRKIKNAVYKLSQSDSNIKNNNNKPQINKNSFNNSLINRLYRLLK